MDEVKPIVVVSQCLGFAAVRYDGQMLEDAFVQALRNHVRFVQICPEIGIGLGVPRPPIRIYADKQGRHLFQPSTSRDLTEAMRQYAESFLDRAGPFDGFILKSRSPSCGIKDVKIFGSADEKAPTIAKGPGLFAEAVLQRFPHAAIEDEGRLTNFRLRHHFLLKLFASARLRRVKTMGALVRFQTEYKLQFMAYSPSGLYELGRIVANAGRVPVAEVLARYKEQFGNLLAQPARPGAVGNALLHAFGYVSKQLAAGERKHFLSLVNDYRSDRVPLTALLELLRSWALRFDEAYLQSQRFFEPYPRELMSLSDSAKTGER